MPALRLHPLWSKYGLSISSHVCETEPVYAEMVYEIHTAVAEYLEAHPDKQAGYFRREIGSGCWYMDIARLAVGELRLQLATAEAIAVNDRAGMRLRFRHEALTHYLERRL